MKRIDTNNDGTWDETFFYAADAQFSTLALLDDAGTVHELAVKHPLLFDGCAQKEHSCAI